MKLIEFVKHLKNIEETEKLLSVELPNVEFGLVDIYLKETLSAESEVRFFDAETIPNNLVIEIDGVKYVNLFSLSLTQEMVQAYDNLPGEQLSDLEIVGKLLEYRIKDA